MEEKILTKEEVLQNGVCFEEELDWGGWYSEQIYFPCWKTIRGNKND